MRIKRFAWLIALVAFALVVAACGGDDDTGGETTTTAASGGETTTTAASGGETTTTAASGGETTTTAASGGEVMADVGVDVENKVIKIGLLSDLTGLFAPLVVDITDAQRIYWDQVNADGGIADGWTVELVVEDTSYNVEQHLEKYERLRNEVLALSQSTGSPTSVAMLPSAIEDDMLFIPLSWYSGWGIPEFDQGLAFEQNANYCIEAMNVVGFMHDQQGAQTIALATFPGDYGQDVAAGVKLAAEHYGMDIVYDGEAAVIPGQDQTPVITEIVNSGADFVFAATNASIFAEIIGGAFQAGYQGLWTGSVPTYDFRLLDTPVGPILDQVFFQSNYGATWGTDVPGMAGLQEAIIAADPDRRPSDAFIIGWTESIAIREVLETAIANGDLTRAGVKAAANSITDVDFEGLAPNQSYAGAPNDYVQRQTAMYKPSLSAYTEAGGAEQTVSQEGAGTTGSVLVQEYFTSDAAAEFEFTAPCYEL
jgi:ABC-type branched-subunit amino acid transport system substrate-binding protein